MDQSMGRSFDLDKTDDGLVNIRCNSIGGLELFDGAASKCGVGEGRASIKKVLMSYAYCVARLLCVNGEMGLMLKLSRMGVGWKDENGGDGGVLLSQMVLVMKYQEREKTKNS
ncbi:hypothetical protein GH714_036954 [Hevea brasiliensis]|uniref:Uncharacterized protein n=1 Tax=Hevea brasiliensis TaxID=3981 RepID=A0A6A6M736_HEVBR|nr:hypothetical protein GH714_036954 [Hevea brasiliensis]